MPDSGRPASSSVTIVVLTHNRRDEVLRTLAHLTVLPERPPIVVVDNGSTDGSAAAITAHFPRARLVRLSTNVGASGRNYGAAEVRTPYVAFSDDDTWWEPGSIAGAAEILDRNPRIAVVCARIVVGSRQRMDPASERMAASPLPSDGLPGTALLGFMAGACVMRVEAFRQVGGYSPQLFIGGEEQLMALDFASLGWQMVYCDALLVHHEPSAKRDVALRRELLARNAIWVAWLRLRWRAAWKVTGERLRSPELRGSRVRTLMSALAGLHWVLRYRRTIPDEVEGMRRLVEASEPVSGTARTADRTRRFSPVSRRGVPRRSLHRFLRLSKRRDRSSRTQDWRRRQTARRPHARNAVQRSSEPRRVCAVCGAELAPPGLVWPDIAESAGTAPAVRPLPVCGNCGSSRPTGKITAGILGNDND